jgi:hypothetical protein
VGLFWRLFAPKPLKKIRRAAHPSWIVQDAIVKGVRGSRTKRRRLGTGTYRYCPRCRKRVAKTAKFCAHCSARL